MVITKGRSAWWLIPLAVAACDFGEASYPDAGAGADAAGTDAPPAVDGAPEDAAAADADADAGPRVDAGPPPDVECPVTVRYDAPAGTTSVHLAGSFNGWSPMADALTDEGTGTWTVDVELAPGVYPYKLVRVASGGEAEWLLDPSHHYRAYDGSVENSGLRVPACWRPRLRVESAGGARPASGDGRIDAVLHYEARLAGPLASVRAELRSGASARALSTAELVVAGDRVEVHVATLADGKHTVAVVATDDSGVESETVLVPVWIEAEPFDWRDALIYMAMTDRFRNGDPANDAPSEGAEPSAQWMGGDLEGLAQAIRDGYFDGLGVRALWLSPFNTNPEGAYGAADGVHAVSGYHGYWPVAAREVDPRLGGADALDDVVRAAHERGIRVLMDLVVNHVHEDHPYYAEHPEWFNSGCLCGTSGCDWTERRLDCLFRTYMPDVNWEDAGAGEQFIDDALYWLERFDLDGFRIDAVKHVVDGAIFNMSIRVRERFETAGTRYFLMGETAQGWDSGAGPDEGGNVDNYGIISRYIAPWGLDGQFDFVLYYAASMQFLRETPGRGMIHIDYWTRASQDHYPAGAIMTPYIGSHDSSRWISLQASPAQAGNQWSDLPAEPAPGEPYDRMYVALAWLLAIPGAPLLYMGDEYGEYGGADPDNRHPMRFGGELSSRESAQLARVRRLGQARADLPGLRRGGYLTLHVTETVWAVARGSGADLVVAVLNRGGTAETVSVPVPAEVAAEGRSFTDALGSGAAASVSGGALSLTLPGRSALYLR